MMIRFSAQMSHTMRGLPRTVACVMMGLLMHSLVLASEDPVYVDAAWAGQSAGTSLTFVFPDGTEVTVTKGLDGFANPVDGVAAVAENGTVYVAAGTYLVGGPGVPIGLHLETDGISLIAVAGAEVTLIDAQGADNAIFIGAQSAGGPHPADILVEGFAVTGWVERGIAQLHGDARVFIDHNHVIATQANSRNAIVISGGTGSEVVGNQVEALSPGLFMAGGAALLLAGSRQALVLDNQLSGASYGIAVAGLGGSGDPAWAQAADNMIADNHSSGNVLRGLVLQGDAQNNIIMGNTLIDNLMAVSLSVGGYGASPSDNQFLGNRLEGSDLAFRVEPGLEDFPHAPSLLSGNEFVANYFHFLDFTSLYSAPAIIAGNDFDKALYSLALGPVIGTDLQSLIDTLAANAPGSTIVIAEGLFDEPIHIHGSLTLRGRDGSFPMPVPGSSPLAPVDHPTFLISSGPTGQALISVDAADVLIEGLIFDVDQSHAGAAIRSEGQLDGLVVRNNRIDTHWSDDQVRTPEELRHALDLGLSNPPPSASFTTEVSGNVITGQPGQTESRGLLITPVFFTSGLSQVGGMIVADGNLIQATEHDMNLVSLSDAGTMVTFNDFLGAGLELAEPEVGSSPVVIADNRFEPDNDVIYQQGLDHGFGEVFRASLRLKNAQDVAVLVQGNEFAAHMLAISAEKMAGLQIANNIFEPTDSTRLWPADEPLRHIIVTNKLLEADAGPVVAMGVEILGNDFGAGNAANEVVAVEFRNHDARLPPEGLGEFVIDESNQFGDDLDWFVVLDDQSFADSATTGLPGYEPPVAATAGAPFGADVDARGNAWAGLAGNNQTAAQRAATRARIFDQDNDPVLGRVILEEAGLVVAPGLIDFGSLTAGQSTSASASFENSGDGLLEILQLDAPVPPFERLGGSCGDLPILVPPGQFCQVTYEFSATNTGSFDQSLAIIGNQVGGSGSLQLSGQTIAGAADRIEAASSTMISGLAGQPVDPGDRPTAVVYDAFDNVVPGTTVGFEVISGGGSATATVQVTDVNGLATVGGWTLGAGDNPQELLAIAPGLIDSPVSFLALADPVADLAISIDDNRTSIDQGDMNTYVIVVSNFGPSDVDQAGIEVALPPELLAATAEWVCYPGAGASCSSAGQGSVSDLVTLAAGSSMTYVLDVVVGLGPTQVIELTATVSEPVGVLDPDQDNNSDSVITQINPFSDELFRDRFELDEG
jgi:parallel beta-helix repeat protein